MRKIIYHIKDCKRPDDVSEPKHIAVNELKKLVLCGTVLIRILMIV